MANFNGIRADQPWVNLNQYLAGKTVNNHSPGDLQSVLLVYLREGEK